MVKICLNYIKATLLRHEIVKKKVIKQKNNNGIYIKVETIEITLEDGFIHPMIFINDSIVDAYKKISQVIFNKQVNYN